jgi:tetratricopeptide (TPR) repeat protein
LSYQEPPQLDEAIEADRRALALDPEDSVTYFHLSRSLALARRFDEAEEVVARLEKKRPENPFVGLSHFWIELAAGHPDKALEAATTIPGQQGHVRLGWVAMALAQKGDLDGAFETLEQAISGGYRDVAALNGSPFFEPLRKDRRFDALLTKHGLR